MTTESHPNPVHAIRRAVQREGNGGTVVFTWCKLALGKSHEHLIEVHTFLGGAEAAMDAGSMKAFDRPLCQDCADALGTPLP